MTVADTSESLEKGYQQHRDRQGGRLRAGNRAVIPPALRSGGSIALSTWDQESAFPLKVATWSVSSLIAEVQSRAKPLLN
jgi:hypothetical protein